MISLYEGSIFLLRDFVYIPNSVQWILSYISHSTGILVWVFNARDSKMFISRRPRGKWLRRRRGAVCEAKLWVSGENSHLILYFLKPRAEEEAGRHGLKSSELGAEGPWDAWSALPHLPPGTKAPYQPPLSRLSYLVSSACLDFPGPCSLLRSCPSPSFYQS